MSKTEHITPTAKDLGVSLAQVIAGEADQMSAKKIVEALLCMAALMAQQAKKRGVCRADLMKLIEKACDANGVS